MFCIHAATFLNEPEADGNLRAVEELAGESDHAVNQIGLDEGLADLAFAGLVGGHAAIGEDEAGHALRGEVVDEVLHPGEVGIPLGRDAELPAHVVVLAEPVAVIEGRVGEDEDRVSPAFCRILDSFLGWLELCFDDLADFGLAPASEDSFWIWFGLIRNAKWGMRRDEAVGNFLAAWNGE